jgi:hypothetical protein
MTDLSHDQRAALTTAQSVLQDTTNPVAVRYVASNEEILDTRFLVVLLETHGCLFDRDKGTTRIIDLGVNLPAEDRQAAIIENARKCALRASLNVVYLIKR